MISMVIATRNRAHTLSLVASSFFEQESVTEYIFVNDHSDDNTEEVVRGIAAMYPYKKLVFITNPKQCGQGQSRNIGLEHVTNEYVLFCDDDEYMEPDYAVTCMEKHKKYNAGVVSGRRVYMREGETRAEALKRFGDGMRSVPPYYPVLCEYANAARFSGDSEQPLVNAIMLTRVDILKKFPFDPYYFQGNGYREESDFHMNLYVNGYKNYMTNACHTVHLPLTQVKTGGQRVNLWRRVYWSSRYNNYFMGKYYDRYRKIYGLLTPKWAAKCAFYVFVVYKEFLRPTLRDIYVAVLGRKSDADGRSKAEAAT